MLFYAKGGAAVGSQNFGLYNTLTGTGLAYAERTRWGGVIGAGLEYGITPNGPSASIRLSLARGDSNVWATPLLAPAVTSISTNTRTDVNVVTLRVNYRFGGPVVAKY